MNPVLDALDLLRDGNDLPRGLMSDAMARLMGGDVPAGQVAELLALLHHKGESVDELVGAATCLREHMQPIVSRRTAVTDTCGTGGSGANTFNISTAAALVAAAAGVAVAKHGNRRSTGTSGSSDVLAELGVNVQAGLRVVTRCLDELGLCFCFAPLHHPSVRHVMDVRRSLLHPTIFNWIGPLCNPARAKYQLLGAGRREHHRKLAEALAQFEPAQALVVHSRDGIGEVSTGAATDGWWIEAGSISSCELDGQSIGSGATGLDQLRVENPVQSAAVIRDVLAGQPGPARDITLLNAAAVLWVANKCPDWRSGLPLAAEAIDCGAASRTLRDLAKLTHMS
jgi:anthranilate phosphoribosyltransferase